MARPPCRGIFSSEKPGACGGQHLPDVRRQSDAGEKSRYATYVRVDVQTLIACLEAVVRDCPLRLVFLFGSAAGNRMHAASDIDLAFWPIDPAFPLRAELDLQIRLERACGRPVDVIRLDRASTLLKWNVIHTGIPVGPCSRPERVRFMVTAALEYADIAPALRRAEERFRIRLASAGPAAPESSPS